MDKLNSTRNSGDKSTRDNLFDFFLKSGLQPLQISASLKQYGMDTREIDVFMEQLAVSKKRLSKMIIKFVNKMRSKYGQLDEVSFLKKGLSQAQKLGFTESEKEAFRNYILNNNNDVIKKSFDEMEYTSMSKFLGFSNMPLQSLEISATDHPALQEIARLYETSKLLHSSVKHNNLLYVTPDDQHKLNVIPLLSKFEEKRDNLYIHVHPLIVALFVPNIQWISNKILLTNIGRLVIQRSQIYFQRTDDKKMGAKYMNWNLNPNELTPHELQSDLQFMKDIATDPNSLDYFSDETPISNLLKRYSVQIELWKNVLAVRQGKFYSSAADYTGESSISGLYKVLSAYSWTYFDSPDMYHINDEGNLLRKLLAVFSIRPTLTMVASYGNPTLYSSQNMPSLSKATYLTSPMCTIRLPNNMATFTNNSTHSKIAQQALDKESSQQSIRLCDALESTDMYIEHKRIVPKRTKIIGSDTVLFFYINRRFQTPFETLELGFQYRSISGTMPGITKINNTYVDFETEEQEINNQIFLLKSCVVLNKINESYAAGCSAYLFDRGNKNPAKRVFKYDPLLPGEKYESETGEIFDHTPIQEYPDDTTVNSNVFKELHEMATILIFEERLSPQQ
jgi:hypothetical protein